MSTTHPFDGLRVVRAEEVPNGLRLFLTVALTWDDLERLHKDLGVELEERARFLETAAREGVPS